MIKKIVSVSFVSVLLFAEVKPIKKDFQACFKNSKKSFVKLSKKIFISVGKGMGITFSRYYIKNYIKRDPFLGLYLVKINKSILPVHFVSFDKLDNSKVVAVIDKKSYSLNHIVSFGNGLNHFAKLSKKVKPNSLIESVCCRNFGLSIGDKNFIDSDFILRFIKNKRVVYADSGLRFEQKGKKIYIKEINPFFHIYGINIGDRVVSIDGKSFNDVSLLSKYILFSDISKTIDIKLIRKKRVFHKKIKLKKRVSGGVLGESFLEYIGLYLKYNLKVSYVAKGSLAYKLGIQKGDRLMKINDDCIDSLFQTKKVLSKLKENEVYLLLSRNDFQFFVHFRR